MNILDYEKEKVKNLSAEQCCWKLFCLTGQINYYLLYSAIKGHESEKEQSWMNLELQEL